MGSQMHRSVSDTKHDAGQRAMTKSEGQQSPSTSLHHVDTWPVYTTVYVTQYVCIKQVVPGIAQYPSSSS